MVLGGKITAKRCNVNHQDKIWKDYVKKETETNKLWEEHWGFYPAQYREMRKTAIDAGVITRRSSNASTQSGSLKLPPLQPSKQDTTRPFPKVTSHEIGWRSDREFSLEMFGRRWGRPRQSIINQLKWPNDAVP